MYGYYLFFGRGDWGTSRDKTLDPTFGGNVKTRVLGDWGPHRQGTDLTDAPQWTSGWSLQTWKQRVDFLIDPLGADTLFLLMNGHELPYPSAAFPEAVELDHANVKEEFLQELLDYARSRGLALAAKFCTSGHAVAYAGAHPECTTVSADGEHSRENLCHNHPKARKYAETVVKEVLGRYRGFSYVEFVPPENVVPCCCEYCVQAYAARTGRDFLAAGVEEQAAAHRLSCLAFLREMNQTVRKILPDARMIWTVMPDLMRDSDNFLREIPADTELLHWNYWCFEARIPEMLKTLRLLQSRGHRVGLRPSAGWGLDKPGGQDCRPLVPEQVAAARANGIEDIVYLVGGIWHEESLLATSWKRRRGQGRVARMR